MLPTKERLTRAGLFQRAYSARKSVGTPFFSLYVLPRHDRGRTPPNASRPRNQTAKTSLASTVDAQELARIQSASLPLVGFVVAKKVSKSACLRNKAKRRLREAYRLLRLSNPEIRQELAQWYAMVFVVHIKAFEASWPELRDAVSESIVRAGSKHGLSKTGKSQPQNRPSGGKPNASSGSDSMARLNNESDV